MLAGAGAVAMTAATPKGDLTVGDNENILQLYLNHIFRDNRALIGEIVEGKIDFVCG